MPRPRKLAHKHTWDVQDFEPLVLNGNATNLFLLSPSSTPPTSSVDRVAEAEERLGHPLPQDYKVFLKQMERTSGVRVPAHLWDKNDVADIGESPMSDSLEELYNARKVISLSTAVTQWLSHSSGSKTHKWQAYPAAVIGSFAFRKLCLFLEDCEGYKKGSIYSYGNGDFENLKFVADSFTDFCNRLFTIEQEEEYYDSIEKQKLREEEQRRYKRTYNSKNDEYTELEPKGATKLHRFHINQMLRANKSQHRVLTSAADKYEWRHWDWKYLRFADKYTKVHIYEDQRRGLSSEEIEALEKEVKGTFPKDFKLFLSAYDGVFVKSPAHTWAKDGYIAFDQNLFNIYGSDTIKSLELIMDERKELFDPSQIQMGSYPAVCIAGDAFYPRVIMFLEDHGEMKKGSVWALVYGKETVSGIKPIADSFTEYCNSFLTEEEEECYYAAKSLQ